jgi:hypothetical protein
MSDNVKHEKKEEGASPTFVGKTYKSVGETYSYVGQSYNAVGPSYKAIGKTHKNCDPSSAQKGALASDQSWQKTLSNSYSTIFGAGSSMFKSLSAKLDSIIASPQGYSPEELAAKNSQALNSAAASAKQVNAAIGANAAKSGDSNPGVESGVVQAERASADTAVENNLSNKEAAITEGNFATGRAERDKAISSEEALPSAAFGAADNAAGSVNNADAQVSQQANANEQASSSWMGMVGGLADSAASALIPKIPGLGPKQPNS